MARPQILYANPADDLHEFKPLMEIFNNPAKGCQSDFFPSKYAQDYVKYAKLLTKRAKLLNLKTRYPHSEVKLIDYYVDKHMQFIKDLRKYKSLCIRYKLI
ncbi:MAG: hypothetical protein K0U41_06500 [Gammaproteobacteria bacterium]|nr:hypothetical protein [Gammaproteobacteria bacterium]